MPLANDTRLLQAIGGDRKALTDLLVEATTTVRAALNGAIPTRWQSLLSTDDVLQQTFLDAFLYIRTFLPQGEGSFTAWLVRLAQRNMFDALRMLAAEKRGGKAQNLAPTNWADSCVALYDWIADVSSTPSRQAMQAEAVTAVEGAIGRLPAVYRQVVQMYDLESRPIEEVAAALERSPGAVYMLRARRHERLRAMMASQTRDLPKPA